MSKTNESKTTATGDEVVLPYPNLKLAQLAYVLNEPKASNLHEQARADLLQGIEQDEMAPYLSLLTSSSSAASTSSSPAVIPSNPELLSRLEAKNKEELSKLEEKIEDAEKNLGETEISDALRAKASYLARIGSKEDALKATEVALEKTAGLGSKIDLRLAMCRIGFFHADHSIIASNIEKAQALVDEGGDWDRRNRLKAYNGLHLLSIRNFKLGGELLLDTISTFTATELLDYDDFVILCILAAVLTLERRDIKKKIIDSPEVIALVPTVPTLKNYTDSLYKCEYSSFFRALAEVEEHHLIPSRLLAVHARYYVREMRIKAYAQLLESYRSVTMKNLCEAFGVSEAFIDADLSRFIAAGRLNCSIDRVNGVVETNRPDAKNARYEAAIKQGDVLLTSVQRLSRVIG